MPTRPIPDRRIIHRSAGFSRRVHSQSPRQQYSQKTYHLRHTQRARRYRWKQSYLLALAQLVGGPLVLLQLTILCKLTLHETPRLGLARATASAWHSDEFQTVLASGATAATGDTKTKAPPRDLTNGGGHVDFYAGKYDLDLFSNFTYFLNDPVRGDQSDVRKSDCLWVLRSARWTI